MWSRQTRRKVPILRQLSKWVITFSSNAQEVNDDEMMLNSLDGLINNRFKQVPPEVKSQIDPKNRIILRWFEGTSLSTSSIQNDRRRFVAASISSWNLTRSTVEKLYIKGISYVVRMKDIMDDIIESYCKDHYDSLEN